MRQIGDLVWVKYYSKNSNMLYFAQRKIRGINLLPTGGFDYLIDGFKEINNRVESNWYNEEEICDSLDELKRSIPVYEWNE